MLEQEWNGRGSELTVDHYEAAKIHAQQKTFLTIKIIFISSCVALCISAILLFAMYQHIMQLQPQIKYTQPPCGYNRTSSGKIVPLHLETEQLQDAAGNKSTRTYCTYSAQ